MKRISRFIAASILMMSMWPLHADEPAIEFLTSKVLVVDPDDNPVQDAIVYCSGLESGTGLSFWNPKSFGPLPELKTDERGMVEMPYPNSVREKVKTGAIRWTVKHPDFVVSEYRRSPDDNPAKIELDRGFRIALTAVNGGTGEPIRNDLYALIGGSNADWKLANNGMLVSPVLKKNKNMMRICQIVDGQPTLFSEPIQVEPGERSRILLKDVKLSVGTRVEGRLDDSVQRPVHNGYVSSRITRAIDMHDWDTRISWTEKTPIKEDGTFVIESLPPGDVLQMIPICDGWVPAKPDQASVQKYVPKVWRKLHLLDRARPQLVRLRGKNVTPKLRMEKSTSVKVSVIDLEGNPLPEANVVMWPNQLWFDGTAQTLGTAFSRREILTKTRAGGSEYKRAKRFEQTTDENGVVVIDKLPAGYSQSIAVGHDDYEMPIIDGERSIEVKLQADVVAEVTIRMQLKEINALGELDNDQDDGDQ